MESLNWEDVQVGQIYKYEEGAFLQSHVLVLSKEISENYITLVIRVTNAIRGCEYGQEFKVGKTLDKKLHYLVNKNMFKNLDVPFEYA